MKLDFSFYQESDFKEIEDMIISSYTWDYPIFGMSRLEFSKGLHPQFTGLPRVWERTAGVYREGGKIAACAINEANDEGCAFFLFDSKERAEDTELLKEMIHFAKTTMASVKEDGTTRYVNIYVPKWNAALRTLTEQSGFQFKGWSERLNILPFREKSFEVALPEGYCFVDGETTPDFYLSNVHMASFSYGTGKVKNSERAFHDLRKMKHYHKRLDLCVLDPMKRPVAMAIIWHDEKMPYCELEPMGVAWWERRKGLATSLLYEAANRVREMFPDCTGMLGGNQPFYERMGFVTMAEIPQMEWETSVYPSWDERSADRDYLKESAI